MRVRAWHQLRSRLAGLAVLILIVGVGGGAALAGAVGARRTQTAYSRLLRFSRDPDVLAGIASPAPVAPNALVADPFYRQIERLPQIVDSVRVQGMEVLRRDRGGRIDYGVRFLAPTDSRLFRTLLREKLFSGRFPNPADPTEVLVNRPLAQARNYRVGQTLTDFAAFPGENRPFQPAEGRPLTLRVVGIAIGPNEVLTGADTPSGLQMLGTPAFARAHQGSTAFNFVGVRLRHGNADVGPFQVAFAALVSQYHGLPSVFSNQNEGVPRVQQAIRPHTLALTLFAVVAGIAVLLVVGQGLARQTSDEAVDYPTLHAIGMTRWQLMALPIVRGAAVAFIGALLAVAVAALASPLTPIGYAKIAEPHPGLALNAAWLAIGALVIVVSVLIVALPSAWFATRDLSAEAALAPTRGRPSWVVGRLAAVGAPAPSVVGTQLALESGRGRVAVPARTAIISAAASITVVALVLTFSAGLNRLLAQQHRWGQNSDAVVDNAFYPLPVAAVSGAFSVAGVRGSAEGNFGDVVTAGRTIPAMGLDGRGAANGPGSYLTLLAGRAATRPDEIALGTKTLRQLHLHLGQVVRVAIGPVMQADRVVGSVVFPAAPVGLTLRPELGDGAQVPASVLAPPAPPGAPPGAIYTFFPVRFGPGDRAAELARLRGGVDPMGACPLGPCVITTQRPDSVRSYGSARSVEYVLVALVAVLGVAAIAFSVGMSIRRRRRDFAILETLGFTGRQLFGAVTWQAMTISVIALLIGIPLGVTLGRFGWHAFAEGLGVGADTLVPNGALVIAAAAGLAVAGALGAFFATSLRRTEPSVVLRTE